MYFVKLDNQTFYDPRIEEYKIFNPKLKLEVNKAGAFDFTVYPSHPLFARIFKLKSIVEVYQDSTLLFRGRVLDDELAFDKAKKVYCEGELAYFNDTVLRPYEHTGSVRGYLELIVNQHNSQVPTAKQFTVGNVTVTDPNDLIVRSDATYPQTWNVVESKLINSLGGYLVIRRVGNVNYLDYLKDSNYMSLQEIKLGKNLLDLATKSSATELYTAILPIGKELEDANGQGTGEYLTIKSVNGGVDYVKDDEAIEKYGFIMKKVEWRDVTIASNLLTKARQELAQSIKLSLSLNLTAIDLSMTDSTIDEFRVFEYVNVVSNPHGIEERLLIEKQELNLTNPSQDKLTIGVQRKSLTETQIQTEKAISNIVTIKGPKGDSGNDGVAGKDGVGIKTTAITYVGSTSGVTKPTTGWVSTIPNVPAGQYLWTRTIWTYTDNSTETGYSVARMGANGEKGDQGVQGPQGLVGPKGADGQQFYTWLKYADTPTSGMSDDPTGKKYIGLAYNKTTATESATYSDYTWSLVQGPQGDQGTQGPKGADGQTTYTWIKYATSAAGANMSDSPTGKTYIGLAYNKTTATESNLASDYTWALIQGAKGDQGIQGLQGPKGDQGIAGAKGQDGQTSYTHIAYADNASGGGFNQSPVNKAYIGIYVDFIATDSTDPSKYKWSLIKGADGTQGVQGPKGQDGQTPYFHTAWANNETGTSGFSTTDSVNKLYIGTYTDYVSADSTDPSKYSWTKIKGDKGDTGAQGPQGIQGPAGTNGTSQYVHIRYSANSNGSGMTTTPQSNTQYIGLANTTSATAPTVNTSYTWTKTKGETGAQGNQGIQGPAGTNGQTTYTWVKYADTNTGTGMSDSPDGKLYIGLAFNKTTATESNTASDYTWSLMPQNIEVGGRNLLLNSGNFKKINPWSGGIIDTKTFSFPTIKGTGTLMQPENIVLKPNTEYYSIMTVWFSKEVHLNSSVPNHIYVREDGAGNLSGATTIELVGGQRTSKVNEWERIVVKFKTKDTTKKLTFRIHLYNSNWGTTERWLKDAMVIEGNIPPTDWTPAPEDIQAELDDKASNDYVTSVETTLNTTIEESAGEFRREISETYTSKNEFGSYQETIATQFDQTAKGFDLTFKNLIEQIETLDSETKATFDEIVKYIRFVDGNIVLGKVGNELELKIRHDRIQFIQSGVEVAYFSNNKLYVTDGEFINSLKLGNFAFIPRENGSLDFRKVVN